MRDFINGFIFLGIIWVAIPAYCLSLPSSNQTILLFLLLEANAMIAAVWLTHRK